MNILMTGATGFLGSNLVVKLIEENHNITVLVRSSSSLHRISGLLDRITVHVMEAGGVQEVFHTTKIDTIIHCATEYGRNKIATPELVEANLLMPLRLLQAGCDAGVRCFINTDTVLDKHVSNYALSKHQFKEWLGRYAQNMVCINVALEHFYGANDDTSKFVSFIIRQLLDDAERIDLTLGEQQRDFIHIDDIVSAYLLILRRTIDQSPGYTSYEAGSGITISIREFVETAKLLTGNTKTHLNFGAIPYRPNEPMASAVNSDSLRELGWMPTIPLAAGLTRLIAQEREIKNI